jgi:DhnA family fructose-bisphosphate aldolase class Ia
MGASVIAYWTGITEEQIESQPGFYNDCKAWGDWMAERETEPEVLAAIRKLNADAILTHITDGMTESEVRWVTPKELRDAALRLSQAVQSGESHEAKIILQTYERNANRVDTIAEEFIRDLNDIRAITEWAEEEGATRMTLEVNW